MNAITDLFKYYSRFVPRPQLEKLFPKKAGADVEYDALKTEILAADNTRRIAGIDSFVCSTDSYYVEQQMRASSGYVLFVEYGNSDYTPHVTDGLTQQMSIIISHPSSLSGDDNLKKEIIMGRCFEMLTDLLSTLQADQEQQFCSSTSNISFPAKLVPVEKASFFDRVGWCAFFSYAKSI